MARIVVAGNVNVETTVELEAFPLAYQPVVYRPHGIASRASGVGFNLARALRTLGHDVVLASIVGRDLAADAVRAALAADGIAEQWVRPQVAQTPQSVVLYDAAGRREVITDLKDVLVQTYPPADFAAALAGCALAILTNIAYTRPLLPLAQRHGIPIATDLHTISRLDDPYVQPWLEAATVVFLSGEQLPEPPEHFARRLLARYPARIVVVGLGAAGALLVLRDGATTHIPAVTVRPVVSTGGAGDALLAAFAHGYLRGDAPVAALRRAVVFAAYKIGVAGSGEGFLDAAALDALVRQRFSLK